MRTDVLNQSRLRLVRSAGLIALAALAAGCSADATRLQDSFYTGAIPPAPVRSQQVASAAPAAEPSYGAGQPNASYGSGTTGASRTFAAATPPVSRSTLPPPPASSYGNGNDSYAPVQQQAAAPMSQHASSPVNHAEVARTEASRNMAPAPTGSAGTYVVTSGDSLLGIARRHNVRAADLRNANRLTDDNVRIGQKLTIPAGGSATASAQPAGNVRYATLGAPPTSLQAQAAKIAVPSSAPTNARPAAAAAQATRELPPVKPAQAAAAAATPAKPATHEMPAVAATPAPVAPSAASTSVAAAAPVAQTTAAKAEEEEQASLAPASTGINQMRWPVQGRVIKNFGDKVGSRRNDGLNISVPRGTPIKAAENGVVIYAGEGLKEFGKTVLVKHENGLVTVYGHADDIKVQRGATVKRGEEIATAGMTGDTDAPMLHFEVRKDSSPVNPMTYLR
ncbi:hypothetical protein M673_11910 [Aureimonas sp. AU20]|nr:hypothetical protein M673_11910 [Aureimonas sp. AU20]